MERPTAEAIDQTIQQFTTLGVDQQVTELDISVYNNFTDKYDTVPASVFALQGYRYRDIFNVFKRERAHLSSVTVWGLADDGTWLSNFPINRLNPPLLFDDQLQAKPAYWGLVDPTKLPPVTRTLTVPAGGTCVGAANDVEWKLLPPNIVTTPNGTFEHFQVRWDKRFLYVRAEVADSTNDRADKVEFYVDDNNGKTTAYEADDAHYTLKRDGSHSPSFVARTERINGGYRVEAALPLRTPGVVDRALGFDLRVTDASRPGEAVSWNDSTSSQDTDTSKWGTLNLATAVSLVDARQATPVVDGVVDAAWAGAPEITTGVRIQGTGGATATAKLLWDDHHIYILAKVTDPVLDESSPNSWEQDSVEFFVDPNNAKTAGYEDDDGQYRVSFTNKQAISSNFGAYAIANNLKSATTLTPGGYLVEASIEVNTVPVARGGLLGFDLQVNDATAGARTAAATWHDPTSLSYLNTSRWGVVRLD
jgi:endo-1,4-beta-xylanase